MDYANFPAVFFVSPLSRSQDLAAAMPTLCLAGAAQLNSPAVQIQFGGCCRFQDQA